MKLAGGSAVQKGQYNSARIGEYMILLEVSGIGVAGLQQVMALFDLKKANEKTFFMMTTDTQKLRFCARVRL